MEVIINGRRAALKKGTSFEYVAENRLFSGSDGYTLSMLFPLRGCPANIAIFGNVGRADAAMGKAVFDCELRVGTFVRYGSLVVTEVNRSEVKTQFLEGRSAQNFDKTLDNVYINELSLGSGDAYNALTPQKAWNPQHTDNRCVALPWVNEASGNIQNLAVYTTGEGYAWYYNCIVRSWQPYLLHITRAIIEAAGYTADLSAWERHPSLKYLLVCNTLPAAWNVKDFARALPKWSVAAYLEKLELFLGGEFTVDHGAAKVSFAFTSAVLAGVKPVELYNVTEDYQAEVAVRDARCDYRPLKNVRYKECSHSMAKFYCCDWLFEAVRNIRTFPTLTGFLSEYGGLRTWDGRFNRGTIKNDIIYIEDVDTHFIVRSLSKTLVRTCQGYVPNEYRYTMELRPVNMFGQRKVNEREEADTLEVEFVPACVDFTENSYGRLLFLSFSGFDEAESGLSDSVQITAEAQKREIDATLFQPYPARLLSEGEKKSTTEYYDRIYLGWWRGTVPTNGRLPHPAVEHIEIADDWSTYTAHPFSMRLNGGGSGMATNSGLMIDPTLKRTFRFLSSTLPNPRAVFHIRGKRYLCEKLTATFTEDSGMSRLIKGEFYPLRD